MRATYSDLSPENQQMIRLMQWVNFGKIEKLQVRAGRIDFTALPTVKRLAKMDGEGMPRHEMDVKEFFLKDCHIALFDYVEYLHDGVIDYVDVKHGLPFLVLFEDNIPESMR